MARQGHGPEEILRLLNDELLAQNPRGMFVTLQILVFDPVQRQVACASAGHHGAVRIQQGRSPEFVFTSSGRVLGLLPAEPIQAETLALQPGDSFVLFTDGVSEAFGPDGELYGDDRLLAHLESSAGESARDTTAGVLAAVRQHAAGTKQSDDITVVAVRFEGSGVPV